MKILITIYKLNISGSATYTLTLAKELKSRGHELIVFCPILSDLAPEFEKNSIRVVDKIESIKNESFDIVVAQHSATAFLVRNYFSDIPMIFISHGVLPFLEQPPSAELNISHYVAVSEEVRDNLMNNYSISKHDVSIIRNGVDTKIFHPVETIKKELKSVLFLTHHRNLRVLKNVVRACKQQKLNLKIVGVRNRELNVKEYIDQADLVISLGRGVLESMACGRAVLVYDYNGGDGMVLQDNIDKIKQNNFSGRRFAHNYKVSDLINEFNQYNQSLGGINRQIVKKEFDIAIAVNNLERVLISTVDNFKFQEINISNNQINLILKNIKLENKTPGWLSAAKIRFKNISVDLLLKSLGQ